MSKRNKFIDNLKYTKGIIQSIKEERFNKNASNLQRDYQKAFIALVDIAKQLVETNLCNKEFAKFLIQESKIIKEIGENYE